MRTDVPLTPRAYDRRQTTAVWDCITPRHRSRRAVIRVTPAMADEIRAARASGQLVRDIAADFNIGTRTVWLVCSGGHWTDRYRKEAA